MAFDFPASPSEGQEFTPAGGPIYTFTGGVWKFVGAGGGASITVADTAPSGPRAGAMWYESDSGILYLWYDDGNSIQWVQVAGPQASQQTDYVMKSGDTMTGNLTIAAGSRAILNGGANAQTDATLKVRSTSGFGNAMEWGHSNQAGYASTLGFEISSGKPFIAFNGEAGATSNTYRSRGIRSFIIRGDGTGGIDFAGVTTASADNQAPVSLGSFAANGVFSAVGIIATATTSTFQDVGIGPTGMASTDPNPGWIMSGLGYAYLKRSGTASQSNLIFMNNAAVTPTQVGSIATNGSVTAYNTSSDERLKEFIGSYDPLKAIDIIRRDPVRDFNWKGDGSYAVGWGAQTSYAISQDLASPPPEDDPDQPWGMDQSKRTPYLWAALAWALDRIDSLEARLSVLEARP